MKLKNTVIAFNVIIIVLGFIFFFALSASADKRKSKAGGGGLEYYKAIVDNNLFRPLGWGKKKPEAPFVLKSTMSYLSSPGESKAIIWVRANKKERVVAIGDKIGGAVVEMITDEEVTLQKGEKRMELSLGGTVFLNAPRGRKGRSSGSRKKQVTRNRGKTNTKQIQKRVKEMSTKERRRMEDEIRRRRSSSRRSSMRRSTSSRRPTRRVRRR